MSEFRIFRYQLPVEDFPEILMPYGAQILSVASPRNGGQMPDLWALVDTTAHLVPRKFRVVGTGHPISERLGRFVGTFALLDGAFIGHVFEAPTSGSVLDAR